jgi:5-oxopent-3-ene-1,2,5-tricarboxylate decarboxylase / 2-hydroxyhepta-2,4-diene-1,7-dioate isomerase
MGHGPAAAQGAGRLTVFPHRIITPTTTIDGPIPGSVSHPMAEQGRGAQGQILEGLRQSSVATIVHWLNGRGYRNAFLNGLTCVRPDLRLVGRARTMRLVPFRPDLADLFPTRDENPHRKAVEGIGEGEVLVIDAHGNDEGGILGDIMTARLKARGAAGLVVDGSLRDVWQIRTLDLPVYVRHVNAAAVQRGLSAVEMDGVIACAGVAVRPGDYVIGDPDGAAIVPAALAAEAAAYGAEHEALEEYLRLKVSAGGPLAEYYPPNEAVRAEYEARRRQGSGG